jgi:hypothetical protein
MVENIGDLRALDLSGNNLSVLDSLIMLPLRFPKLRKLKLKLKEIMQTSLKLPMYFLYIVRYRWL